MNTDFQGKLRALGLANAAAGVAANGKSTQGSGAAFLEVLGQARTSMENGETLMKGEAATVGRLPAKNDFQAERPARSAERTETDAGRAERKAKAEPRNAERDPQPRAEKAERTERPEPTNRAADQDDPVARTDDVSDGHPAAQRNDRGDEGGRDDAPKADAHDARADKGEGAREARTAQGRSTEASEAAEAAAAQAMAAQVAQQQAGQTDRQREQGPRQAERQGPAKEEMQVRQPSGRDEGGLSDGLQAGRGETPDEAKADASNGRQQSAGEQGRNQAQAHAAQQAQAKAADPSAVQGGETKAQQAAQIARMVGPGNDLSIQVQVQDETLQNAGKPSLGIAGAPLPTEGAGSEAAKAQAPQPQANPVNGNTLQLAQQAGQQAALAAQGPASQPGVQAGPAMTQVAGIEGAKGPAPMAMAGQTAMTGNESPNAAPLPGQTQQSPQAQQSSQTQAAHQPRFSLPGQGVADQISVHISKALQDGNDKITIQLKPAHLGRVEVNMEMSHDGRLIAVVTADSQSTLDLLKRDASELQKSLQQAGLQLDSGDLSFNLREQGFGQARNEDNGGGRTPYGRGAVDERAEADQPDPALMARSQGGITADGRVDIRA
jgi:hypothetical protein